MNRRGFVGALLGASAAHAAAGRRPNVVIILADDLGYGDLGCYGNRIIETPHLDGLAARGARFTDFHTTSPVCSPSRVALFTGQYPQRYNIHRADLPESLPRHFLPGSVVTLAKVLKKIQVKNHHPFHFGGPGRMNSDASKAWLFRFDGK